MALAPRPLSPVTATLTAMFGTSTEIPGLAPDLIVADPSAWQPTSLLAGDALDLLLEAAGTRWKAQPHAAAALAWKAYTYLLAPPAVVRSARPRPAVFGLGPPRRVPLLTSTNVLMHFRDPRPLVTIGLHPDTPIAVL